LIALIQGVLKVDFMSAVNYLKELCGEVDNESITEFKRKKEKESFINRYKTSKIGSNIVTESQLEQFKFFRSDFFLNQGFTSDVLDYFEIAGGYKDKFGVKRDIIPIRDVKGSLVAYSLRDVSSDDPELKYILTDGFDKNSVLYNLHNIEVSKPIVVVEGFKSVWRLKQYGIDNVVAVIGSEVTLGQQHLLYGYGQAGVVILFDNDNAGVVGCTNAYNSLNGKIAVTPIIITEVDDCGRGLDPADLSKKTIYKYLGRYV
jgi:DNA primase